MWAGRAAAVGTTTSSGPWGGRRVGGAQGPGVGASEPAFAMHYSHRPVVMIRESTRPRISAHQSGRLYRSWVMPICCAPFVWSCRLALLKTCHATGSRVQPRKVKLHNMASAKFDGDELPHLAPWGMCHGLQKL